MSDNQLSPRDKETMLALKTKELALREREIEIEAQKQKRGMLQLIVAIVFGLLIIVLATVFLLRDSGSTTAVVNSIDNNDEQGTSTSNAQLYSTSTAQAIALADMQAANNNQSQSLQGTATAQAVILYEVQATKDAQIAIIAATSTALAQVVVAPTVAPIPTLNPEPTSVPTVIPTVIASSETNDTPIDAVLKPGEVWLVNGLEIVLENPTFNPGCSGTLGFEIVIRNKSGKNKKVGTTIIYISDDKANNYGNIFFKTGVASPGCYSYTLSSFKIDEIESDSYKDYAFRTTAEIKPGTKEIIVMMPEVYERVSPKWSIDTESE